MAKMRKNSVVTITGGTGSFGATMAKDLLAGDVSEVRIFSRDENKQDQMRNSMKDERLRFFIGDVRDRDSLVPAIKGVDYIFHAAALKQVPSCEFFPLEAVKTNIIGTDNVLTVAQDCYVKKVY
jgi:UDP-glucose 4-epimerase